MRCVFFVFIIWNHNAPTPPPTPARISFHQLSFTRVQGIPKWTLRSRLLYATGEGGLEHLPTQGRYLSR